MNTIIPKPLWTHIYKSDHRSGKYKLSVNLKREFKVKKSTNLYKNKSWIQLQPTIYLNFENTVTHEGNAHFL